ncbi:hypothetical protein L4G92_01875 [Neisseria sp. ZJ106]|uniref:MFS transporter n=1 Tax=Neisseria lisongii TaxID=2912188 RepID=A0ABY7RGX4_9NEIS|nr:hypothetical protein [Neisseria lisongii]MCF7520803.1 hypothetical protein [Neisseria lisongii]WCL70740.1 hypothetical protein PJU73_04945 [Neisseria lisongii]
METKQHNTSALPENTVLPSAQAPITDFKGLLTTLLAALFCFGIYSKLT